MRCPECGGEIEVAKDNEYYCKECGLVMEKLEMVPSKRTVEDRDLTPRWERNLRQTGANSWSSGNKIKNLKVI